MRLAPPTWSSARAFVFGIAYGVSAASAAAQGTITGHVTAQGTNAPLGEARIIVIGSTASAMSAEDGKYTLNGVRAGVVVVQVLRIGYSSLKKNVTVTAGGPTTADFQLEAAIVKLQDVVTTATGQQRKVELGNALTDLGNVSLKVEQTPIHNINDLLTQRAPGVSLLGQGQVGSGAQIRIRGLNSLSLTNGPIVLVDGVRVNSSSISGNVGGTNYSALTSFSPEEIEDIEIVKGPSAATLYGTDAANGVILISTKKGRAGNTKWTWTGEQGTILDRNDYPTNYAIWGHAPNTTAQIRCFLSTLGPTSCIQDSLTSLNIAKHPELSSIHSGTRALYGGQINGGAELVRYYFSGNLENEIGPIKMPGFAARQLDSLKIPIRDEWTYPEALQRENVRMNVTATLSPKVDMNASVGFVKSDQRLVQSDNNVIGLVPAMLDSPGFAHAGLGYTNLDPVGYELHGHNRYSPAEIMQDLQTLSIQRMTGSANATWRPFTWMQNDGTVGIDLLDRGQFGLCRLDECPPNGTLRQGSVSNVHGNDRNFSAKMISTSTWNFRPTVNAKTTFGADYINSESDQSSSSSTQLPPGAQTVAAGATRTGSDQQATATKTLGLYVQEQVGLHDRLFLTAAVRSDQNSAFGTNFQRVFYPKASLSWSASDESYFPKWAWLNQFRLRAAYGESGVQPGATTSLRTFSPVTSTLNGVDTPGLRANALGNPDLKPETATELETGFEARLLKNRLNLDFTYYTKKTHDALISLQIAPSQATSSTSVLTNLGAVANAGVEGQVNVQVLDNRMVSWDMTIGMSHNSNRIITLGNDAAGNAIPTIGTGTSRQGTGYPIDAAWYRPYTWADANKDGLVQVSEVQVDTAYTFRGQRQPKDIISVASGVDLFSRALRLNFLLDYKGGHVLSDGQMSFVCQQYPSCADESLPGIATERQARNVAYRYGTVVNGTTYTTESGYIQSGQFWRLREVSANYTLPTRASKILRTQSTTLVASVRNLKFWTKYTGIDPELTYGSGDEQSTFNSSGPPTYVTFRLNLHY